MSFSQLLIFFNVQKQKNSASTLTKKKHTESYFMKNLATKLFAVIFVIMLAAGCASSITAPDQLQSENQITKQDAPAPSNITNGSEMTSHVEKPPL